MKLLAIEILVLDVDGVLTDGRIWPVGGEVSSLNVLEGKAFHVQDGCAIKLWQQVGRRAAVVSGRKSSLVESRARELGIDWCHTGVGDKTAMYEELKSTWSSSDAVIAVMGDDLPDLGPMRRCGFPIAVANAVPVVKRAAQYVTRRSGGCGAVAEVVEFILRKQGRWCPSEFSA
ncbi:MAG: HAD hydrolase family protein [Planctomycetota bacterium]